MTVRTRFAPSPTGELHLGNARTAVLNWAFARHHGGAFVLRFEDTDAERVVPEAEARIREGIEWLGLEPDEGPFGGGAHGPYRQSERLEVYRAVARRLREEDAAYPCYCTPDELEARRERARRSGERPTYDGRCRDLEPERARRLAAQGRRPALRFRTEPGAVRFRDRVRGEVAIDARDFGDFVILRADGRPTYNFAVVVDDLGMEISHVIRGAGHLANTPKQVLLYGSLGEPPPEFVHVPLVLAPGGGRLSKREGAPGVLAYRDAGYHPDAVVNYLSLLSWSSESGEEFLTRDRIVAEVDLDRIRASDAELDPEKMRWLSGRHIREEDVEGLLSRLRPFVDAGAHGLSERDLRATAEVLRDRIQLLGEAREEVERIFGEPDPEGTEARGALESEDAPSVLAAVLDEWEALETWSREEIGRALERARAGSGAAGAAFYRPIRAAFIGEVEGPEVSALAYALGPSRALKRVRRARESVSERADV